MSLTQYQDPQVAHFVLSYYGGAADNHRLDLYDASASFYGFARTVAILGHYYSTGKLIAQAPSSSVKVYLEATEEGSVRQMISAAAIGAIVSTPLTVFITRTLDTWIPAPDSQSQQIIELLQEQNRLLASQHGQGADSSEAKDAESVADEFIENHEDEISVLRSITSGSFKDIFRPVGRSVENVGIASGRTETPIGVVNQRSLSLIQADKADEEVISLLAVVNSFSRSSKTGVVFSKDFGRGFRIEYSNKEPLTSEDDFSWSQYYQKPVRLRGRFFRFFDGSIKKFIVYGIERATEIEAREYRQMRIEG